jgi:hypothetical protein
MWCVGVSSLFCHPCRPDDFKPLLGWIGLGIVSYIISPFLSRIADWIGTQKGRPFGRPFCPPLLSVLRAADDEDDECDDGEHDEHVDQCHAAGTSSGAV